LLNSIEPEKYRQNLKICIIPWSSWKSFPLSLPVLELASVNYTLISLYNKIAVAGYEIMNAHALVAGATNISGGEYINHSLSVVICRHFQDTLR
jgi:hypothetical protein